MSRSTWNKFEPRVHLKSPVLWAVALALGCGAPLLAQASSPSDAEPAARYPYDPACPWGRLANGQGMIRRCLSKQEAATLAAGQLAGAESQQGSSPKSRKAADARKGDRSDGQAAGDGPAAGDSPAGAKGRAEADGEAESDSSGDEGKMQPASYELSIGPIEADQGEISIGALARPVDRYRKCIDDAGGLQAKQGRVVVKFLVRGERQRAEGVEVDRFSGVSEEAADCIAYVVDRRRVGTPTVPLTGARLTFELEAK